MNIRKIAIAFAGALFVCVLIICIAFGITKGYAVEPRQGQNWASDTQNMLIKLNEEKEQGVFVGEAIVDGVDYKNVVFTKNEDSYRLESDSNILFEGKFKGLFNERVVIGDRTFLVYGGE